MSHALRAGFLAILMIAFTATPRRASAELITALTSTGSLITFDSATPGTILTNVSVTGLVGGDSLVGIDLRPANGGFFGLGSGSRLYLIDRNTGAASQVGSDGAFTLNGTAFGIDFNPTVDRIRVTSDADQNLRLVPNDGTLASADTALAYAAGDVNAGANPNVVASGYTNSFAGATTTTLFNIDSTLNILTTQIPPNNGTLNTVGALGVDVPDALGFDISGATNAAFLAFGNQLYSVNLGTGAATSLGAIGGGFTVSGITVVPSLNAVPEPGTLALAGLAGASVLAGGLVRRRRSA